ncbi:MAG: hypothetical protein PHV05_06750 [Candidatus Riflebacteria bacterium]|nr:hypothetical protein [Candidatus Riflebacteria bacterium]
MNIVDGKSFWEKLDKPLLLRLCVFTFLSAIGAYFCQPLISNNEQAQNIIITVFSILAGFLIAIITFIGEQISIYSQNKESWRMLEGRRPIIQKKLIEHKLLFWIYMIVLLLIFICTILKPQNTGIAFDEPKLNAQILASDVASTSLKASGSFSLNNASDSAVISSNQFKNKIRTALEFLFSFLSVFAFLASMLLPQTLMSLQLDKLDAIIDDKKTTIDEEL